MQVPQNTKYRKAHKGRIHGKTTRGNLLSFGSYGIKSVDPERVTSRQIEAARKAIVRYVKRAGKLWIRVFPDVPVSKKPAEVRMGKGKGSVEYYAVRVKPGKILFELEGVDEDVAKVALEKGAAKLPVRTKFIKRLGE